MFWVATSEGLEAFDRSTAKVTYRIPLRQEVREFTFHEDAHGTFWVIYGSGNGLGIFDRKTNKLTRYSFAAGDNSLTGVYAILETDQGDIWLATMGSGLLRFDRQAFKFIRYRNDPNDSQSLAENRSIALFQDLEGNVWAGLHASPPNTFPRTPPPFRRLWPFPGHVDKLGESLVNTIFEDEAGAVWLGAGGALNRIDPAKKDIEVLTPAGPGTSVEVLAIAQDATGTMWIGTLGNGLYAFDPKTRSFKSYRYDKQRPDSLSSDIVTRIHIASDGDLWLTTWNGIDKFIPATGRFLTFRHDKTNTAEPYYSIVPDDGGTFWIGTTSGLVNFNPATAEFKTFKHDPEDPASLSNNTVNAVYAAERGVVWVGTQNGLNRLDTTTGKFQLFFAKDGLAGNVVSCMVGDDDGHIWMSTNRGISKFDVAKASFENYSSSDGLPGEDLTGWNACYRGRSGSFYFAGFAGATFNTHEEPVRDGFVPPLVFSEVRIGARQNTLPVSFNRGPPSSAPLSLPYNDSQLSVSFAALSYISPQSTRYRYKLWGFDQDWQMATSAQRSFSYAAIPPGQYSLVVQAATKRGQWNVPGASLQITVLPPWWTTWWFRTGAAGLLTASLLGLYRYRLQKVSAQYAIRLEERIGERNRLARELHDTLLQSFQGLIFRLQAARHMLPQDPQKAADLLDIVLEKSDEAILEGRNAVQALRYDITGNADIIEAVKTAGEDLARASPEPAPAFAVTTYGLPFALEVDARQEIYRIIVEALRNAFKHAEASSIECNFHFDHDVFRAQVRDDGRGMAADTGDRKGERRWGMSGMKERADRIGANLMIESLSGEGTTIEISMKLGRLRGPRNIGAAT